MNIVINKNEAEKYLATLDNSNWDFRDSDMAQIVQGIMKTGINIFPDTIKVVRTGSGTPLEYVTDKLRTANISVIASRTVSIANQ